ncbi:putative cystathionine beta-synthase [bacterium BMS3Abin02]|nr:putative cystathionine beta-synthase [bacterium BMS3Abin02]GBE20823.1 putative cystathionine beta-synthase [bacterium BMS3Bbin01]HDL49423.1 pyridoxal-phosphate dependent enzyme [Actinomycetota bacterium]
MIYENAIEAIGRTPIVRLSRVHPPGNLVAKLEFLNPGGSIKERIAVTMIDRAEQLGLLEPGGTIVEPTSGNTGVGLAIVAAVRGYEVVFTVPDKVSKEKQDLLRAYGATVIVTPTELLPDDPESYYGVARRIVAETPGAYSPDQYTNPANPEAHYLTTGPEIWDQTEGRIGALVAGVGTGGTVTGAGRYLKEMNPDILVIGADPEGSIYTALSDDEIHQYDVEGVGEDFWPETLDPDIVDEYVMVSDADAFMMTRSMARREGLLVGGSAGMAAYAAAELAEREPDRLTVVILPDSGRGYLSKIFNDEWMREHDYEVS